MSDNNKALFNFIRVAFSIMIILLVVYAGVKIASKGYEFGYRVFTETAVDGAPGRDVLVLVEENMSERDIANMLEEKGLVRDASLFYLQIKLSAYSGKFLPGVYTLNTSMEPKTMMVIMATKEEPEETESAEPPVEDSADDATTETDGASDDTAPEAEER